MIFDCIMDCSEYCSLNNHAVSRYLNHPEKMPIKFQEKGLKFYDKHN